MAANFERVHAGFSEKTSDTTATVTVDTTVVAGRLLIAAILFDNAATASKPVVSSITKMAGETNNWVFLGAARSTSTSAGAFASGELWCIKTSVAWSVASYTATLDTAVTMKATLLLEWSGVEATLRSTVGTAYSTTTTAASATTTGTAPVVGDLAIGFLFGSNVASGQSVDTDTTGGSWSASPLGIGSTGSSGATNNFGIVQYKVVTSTSHQTYNSPATLTAGNGSIVAVLQATIDPLVTQAAYRFYSDGTESGSTALGTQDTAYTADLSAADANLQLRVRLQETAGGIVPATDDWALQYKRNGDGYAESNRDSFSNVGDNSCTIVGQSFLGDGTALRRAGFYLLKNGSPSTTLTASLYAHTGTFGAAGSTGTGSPLATSTSSVSASTVDAAAYTWYYFDFDGTFTLTAGTPYVIAIESALGTVSNFIRVASDTTSSTHPGRLSQFTTGWLGANQDLIFDVGTWTNVTASTLSDSYPESNEDSAQSIGISTGSITGTYVAVHGDGKPLTRLRAKLRKNGTPTGTLEARLYAHSGTYGSGTPTGSVLATSTSLNPTTLGSVTAWTDLDFDGSFTLASGTNYFIGVEATGHTPSDANSSSVGTDVGSPTYAGNGQLHTSGSTWGSSARDLIFELYTAGATTVVPYVSALLDNTAPSTNRLTGGSGTFVAGDVTEDGVANDQGWSASNFTEHVYSITLKKADLADADTLRFRVLRNGATTSMTYTVVPTANVSVTSGPTGTATFTGSGSLTTAQTPGPTPTVALSGSGTLSTAVTVTTIGTATLSGSGSLTTTQKPSIPVTTALSGDGTLTVVGVPGYRGTATLSGDGSLTSTQKPGPTPSAALSGAGTLTTVQVPRPTQAAALSGSGTLTTAQTVAVTGTAALSGSGSLTTTQKPGPVASAALSGAGSLTTTQLPGPVQTVALTGDGSLSAVGVPSVSTPIATITSQLFVGGVPVGSPVSHVLSQTSTNVYAEFTVPGLTLTQLQSGTLTVQHVVTRNATTTSATVFVDSVELLADYQTQTPPGTGAFTGTATLSGDGSLSTTQRPGPTQTVALSGSGTLTTAQVPGPAQAVALSGSGTLSTTQSLSLPVSVALSGSGTLTTTAAVTAAGVASLSGSGTLSTVQVPRPAQAATLTGDGTLTAVGVAVAGAAGTATLSGSGTLSTTQVPRPAVTATLSGSGTLSTTQSLSPTATVSLSGSGSLTTTQVPRPTQVATLSGDGTLSTTQAPKPTGTATLSGDGTLFALGVTVGQVNFNGTGTLTTTQVVRVTTTATLSGSGSLTTTAVVTLVGTATLSGSGSLTTTQKPGPTQTAALSGTGTLTTTQAPGPIGTATLSGDGTLTSTTQVPRPTVTVALSGTGTLSATGTVATGFVGTATLSGSGTLATSQKPGPTPAAALTGSGSLTTTAVVKVTGATATLSGSGTLTAGAVLAVGRVAVLSGSGTLTVAVVAGEAGTATLTGSGTLTTTGVAGFTGVATLSGSGTLAYAAAVAIQAAAALSGVGNLTTTGVTTGAFQEFVGVIPI